MTEVQFNRLTFTYRDAHAAALRDVDLAVQRGERVVVMGAGGSGKSSLCFAVNGVIPRLLRGSYQGSVLVGGQEVAGTRVGQMARLAGLVMQNFESQIFCPTVELEIAFGPENCELPVQEIRRRVERYLALVRMERMRDSQPAQLSGGQQQRLAIGAVMALEPRVLLLDEPCTDLDPVTQDEILKLLDEFVTAGQTCIMTEHRIETALNADRICLMKDGAIVGCGKPKEVAGDMALLRSCAVRPPGLVELFHCLGLPGVPLTCGEAVAELARWKPGLSHDLRPGVPSSGWGASSEQVVTSGLTHAYKRPPFQALKGVDLRIGAGEFVAIIGANGSGKTTLLKHLGGLLKPTSGQVRIQGKPVERLSRRDLASRVGFVFQNPDHQIFSETVKSEIGFSLQQFGYPPGEVDRRVAAALRSVGMEEHAGADPTRLTKGQRQRIAVASVLVSRPEILLLDEPTTGLDFPRQQSLMEVICELHRSGKTVLMATHALWLVAEHAQRVVVLNEGQVVLDGPTRAVLARASTLLEASIRVPPLVQLANELGLRSLDAPSMARELVER